jgi:F-type H+-transporting ATPase subunit gamma
MGSSQQLKSRIRSVKNTKQITKAMQMVAASKMRRAQELDQSSAPYAHAANELLTYLAAQGVTDDHVLFQKREVKTRLLIVIAADKGLAGAYNSNVVKTYISELTSDDKRGIKNTTIAVGRRASQAATRLKDTSILAVYEDLPDHPAGSQLRSILDTARDMFVGGEVDAVDLVFTEFISSINQQVVTKRILPAGFETTDVTAEISDSKFEPDITSVLDGVAYRLVEAQVFQALLDARASEYSMRMVAMKNATDNASDLADDLTLAMNKARQGAITQELAEISGGVEALNQ